MSFDLLISNAKAAAEADFDTMLGQMLLPLDAIKNSTDPMDIKTAKLRPLHAALTGVVDSSTTAGTATGPNADEVNLIIEAATRVLPTLSLAECKVRQGFAVRLITGDINVTNGGEIQEIAEARSKLAQADVEVRNANTAKATAEQEATDAKARVAALEALLRRTKSAIKSGGLGGEGIRDAAILNEIKAAV